MDVKQRIRTCISGIHTRLISGLYAFQANDGVFSAICGVNITIRDVNNHAPQFLRDHYVASVAENTGIGKYFDDYIIQMNYANGELVWNIQRECCFSSIDL